jgi:D-alanyl-D-alanine carboxypeptidase/D-alanyl-D-alanine-endopeptidase (penicillin-binding protein 4)
VKLTVTAGASRRAIRVASFAVTIALVATSMRPAFAIDRTWGAAVPKPSATGEPWTDAAVASLDANIDITVAGSSALHGAHVGILAIDARDGRVLYQRNADDLFEPASTLKLLVGSVALEKLGPDYRFHTDAVITTPIVGGVVAGQLIVRAGGDPFLNADDFDKLATTLVAQGMTSIRGGVVHAGAVSGVGDGIAFDVSRYEQTPFPPGWLLEDLPYGYSARVGALAFEHNSVHVTVAPGPVVDGPAVVTTAPIRFVGQPIEGCNFSPTPMIINLAKTGPSGAVDSIDLAPDGTGCATIKGTIPFGSAADTLESAVPSSTVYAEQMLRAELTKQSITAMRLDSLGVPDQHIAVAPPGSTVMWMHDSEPMSDVVGDMWMPSDNLAAEMLLRELSFANATVPGTTADGIAVETAWLKNLGVDTSSLALSDGSGLSSYDRITPRALVTILQHDWNGPLHDVVLDDLPIAGVRGTIATSYLGTALEKRVFAKTGTTSRASALAGYAATEKHGTVIFAFMVDESVVDPAVLRDLRARILTHFIED